MRLPKTSIFDDKLTIYVKANSIGNSSVDIHYLAKDQKNETCFTGRGTIVQIDRKTGKGTPWSEQEKAKFQQ